MFIHKVKVCLSVKFRVDIFLHFGDTSRQTWSIFDFLALWDLRKKIHISKSVSIVILQFSGLLGDTIVYNLSKN